MDLFTRGKGRKGGPASGGEGTEGKDLLKQAGVVVVVVLNRTSLVICNR